MRTNPSVRASVHSSQKTRRRFRAQNRARKCERRKRNRARIGYVLYETADIVVIATLKSKNRKTGRMVQVWILLRKVSPIKAVQLGLDQAICFECPHRGEGFKKRTCYVNLRSPQAIWRAYRRGRYQHLAVERYTEVFAEAKIRFGAYGEPILIPLPIVEALTIVSRGWTGYTHQWRRAEYQPYRAYIMASCDNERDAIDASAAGWRYFRVRSEFEPLSAGEISCPASEEMGHRTTCAKCLLCSGARANDARKNIAIIVHGSGKKNFVALNSILPAPAAA